MSLIYDGVLTNECQKSLHLMLDKYGYIVEIPSSGNETLFKALQEGLEKHRVHSEDCMGNKIYYDNRVHYMTVWKNGNADNGLFLGLETKKEYDWLIENHGNLLVNAHPFKTLIENAL